ncbi:type IV secretory system conjugative DNA transfer family protein [Methylosinus sp. PW1]|uniref:type IV secretory system conjugative DNA transfer family protein n=1 Tax=Methylosinus sp. PW1 TaxID=107636 RepID=UPI00055D4EC4|nr:type IV secretory system conjugative DNA transfer family protein [Methylosinus sp. PW1]
MNAPTKAPPRRSPRAQKPSPQPAQPRRKGFSKTAIALLLLYAAFMAGTAWGLFGNLSQLFARAIPPQAIGGLAVDFWGLAVGLVFLLVLLNPFAWVNGKRLVAGSTALAMMFGCISMNIMGDLVISLVGLFLPDGIGMLDPVTPGFFIVLLGTLLLVPLALIGSGGLVILTLFGVVSAIFTFFVGVPVMLFKQILEFENMLQIYRVQARGLAGYIVRFFFWLRSEAPPNAPDDSKGARFAAPEEIARLHNPKGMGFGHAGGRLLQLHTEKHVLIMASTRSGKGVTLIIPHLLRYRGSAFVLDPKGENAKATGRQRAALNQKVFYLDPFGISGKPQARFNPLSRFTPQNMEAESKALAAALFIPGEGEKRDHWFNAAQQLFALLLMFVYVSPEISPAKKDLLAVRRRLLGDIKPTLEAMLQIDDADGLLRDLALSFLETPDKELGSIISAAQRQTDILDNPAMIACLSASGQGEEVDFRLWHRGTMTVYLCLSAPKFPVFNRWLRLVLTSALDEMTDTLDPPPLPVCFMLDEMATLGHVQPIENAIGLAAGYGVQLICVFQDVAQMKDLYKGRWASFVGNAGVRALFNLDDYDTAKYWSDFMGGRLVETHGRQEDLYGLSKGQNVGEAVRPLLSPEQIMLEFGHDRMLVLPQGERPIATQRKAYWDDPALNGLWDDPRTGARGADPAGSSVAPDSPFEIDRHQFDGKTYAMFSDGSVKVYAPQGTQRYPSLDAVRAAEPCPCGSGKPYDRCHGAPE